MILLLNQSLANPVVHYLNIILYEDPPPIYKLLVCMLLVVVFVRGEVVKWGGMWGGREGQGK